MTNHQRYHESPRHGTFADACFRRSPNYHQTTRKRSNGRPSIDCLLHRKLAA